MSDASNNMPARIWVDEVGGDFPVTYHRADIVERLAEAASKFVAACSDKHGEWNGLSFIDHGAIMDSFADVRDALNSYREASNVEA